MTERGRMEAVIVTRNGGAIARTTVQTHPMPSRILIGKFPFDIELEYFLCTGKAVYSGYWPRESWDD